jgi:hypothetical protein
MANATERSRLCRQRRRDGRVLFTIGVRVDGLRDLLLASNLIDESDLWDMTAVRRGFERLVDALTARP